MPGTYARRSIFMLFPERRIYLHESRDSHSGQTADHYHPEEVNIPQPFLEITGEHMPGIIMLMAMKAVHSE